jgi:cell cycle checkpoint protein
MARRRKAVVESDEDDTPSTPAKGKGTIEAAFARAGSHLQNDSGVSPIKLQTLPTRAALSPVAKRRKSSAPSSQSNSPAAKSKSKDKNIYSFFNSVTQQQQSNPSNSPLKLVDDPLDLDDDIIQNSSDEETDKAPSVNSLLVNGGKKRKLDAIDGGKKGPSFTPGAQKFLKPSQLTRAGAQSSSGGSLSSQHRPWTDQYGPIDLDELAVHKRKVQDLRDCLTRSMMGKARTRLIVLKGGAGTGKTMTVKLLSESLGLKIIEWRNPDLTRGQEGGTSITAQFEDFINRTCLFGTLSFGETEIKPKEKTQDDHGYVVLVEEFPNTFSRSSSTLQGFRRATLQYLTTSTPSPDDFFSPKGQAQRQIVPIIMVISESLLTTPTASSDSFTAHRLLGTDILNHPGTAVLEFNPVAPTFMLKALDIVLKKEARKSGRRFAPGPAVLKHLSEVGDIRSAISALEFFCIHDGSEEDWSGKINFGKSKKTGDEKAPTAMEKQSLQMITQRENTLGIFHAVGKVVYNKREIPAATDTPPPQPPSYYPQHARPKVSEVNVDSLLNELGTDIHIFISALHENYVLSCQGIDEEDTLDSISGCIDSLSEADLLCPDRFTNQSSRTTWQATSNDTLRQDSISFFTGIQGCLFYLPHPVKRANPPADYVASRGKTVGKTTAFQMLYPTSLRLWRKKDQIEESIDQFNAIFRNGQLDGSSIIEENSMRAGSVETWSKRSSHPASTNQSPSVAGEEKSTVPFILRGMSREEVLLERLPAMNLLQRRKPFSQRSALAQLIYKIVHLGGLSNSLTPEEEEDNNEENQHGENWSTDKPTEESKKWRKSVGLMTKNAEGNLVVRKDMENLVLSDDDIEDDD